MSVREPVPYVVSLAADRKFYAEYMTETLPLAPLSSLVDHFDHIAQVAGIDHVGIGTDFDGIRVSTCGFEHGR